MKTKPGGESPPPANPDPDAGAPEANMLEADCALWTTLGHSRPPARPGPFFARRALREVTRWEEERAAPVWERGWRGVGIFGEGRRRRAAGVVLAASAACAVTFAVFGGGLRPSENVQRLPRESAAAPANPTPAVDVGVGETPGEDDANVIADLDELLESEENQVWLEEDTAPS